MSEPIGQGLHYYVLPDDPVAALNILREAAGMELWPDLSSLCSFSSVQEVEWHQIGYGTDRSESA